MIDAHRDFIAAIAESRSPRITPEEGTRAIEVANAVYLSATRGEPVALPLAAGAYAPVYERLSTGAVALPKLGRRP